MNNNDFFAMFGIAIFGICLVMFAYAIQGIHYHITKINELIDGFDKRFEKVVDEYKELEKTIKEQKDGKQY